MEKNDSPFASSDHRRLPRRAMHQLIATARIGFVVIIFPILLGAVVLSAFLHSVRGHAYLLGLIQQRATESLGVAVHLQNFNLHLSALSLDLYGLTVDGAGPHPNPPLLQVRHAEVGVRIVSVFGREWYFNRIRIDNPVAQICVDKNGVSNIPTFTNSATGNNTGIFDLGIRHAVVVDGAVFYNNKPSSIDLDLRAVKFNSTFNSLLQQYSGSLAYSDGQLTYSGTQTPPHALNVHFDATPTTLHLSPVKIQSGNTQLTLSVALTNYSAPFAQGHYDATVDGQELARFLGDPSIPSGLMSITGDVRYQTDATRTLVQSLVVNGELSSHRLITTTPKFRTEISNLAVHYSLANGDAALGSLSASLLGGRLTAQGTIKNIGGDSHSNISAALRGISLADAARAIVTTTSSKQQVAIAGVLNATATGSWGKKIADLVAHTDATINGGVANARTAQPAPGQPSPQSLTANTSQNTGTVPVDGVLHATYTGHAQQLALDHSFLRTAHTSLSLNGTISKSSSTAVQLQANDLHELDIISDLFRSPSPGQSVQPLGLGGAASFDGVVRGSTMEPHLTGQLTAQNLQFQGSSWKLLRAAVDASPSNLSLQNAELESASQGNITFNAKTQLNKWSFSKASLIELQLHATQLDVTEVAKLTGQKLPVTGTLTSNIALRGSLAAPQGNGSITLTKAAAYGEPISTARVSFEGSGDQATANLSISAPAGTIEAKVVASLNAKTYSAELTSSGVRLEKLESLKASDFNPVGTVSISGKGQGTFDNPQFDASIQIPSLLVQEQTLSNIRLNAGIANHQATALLNSSAFNTAIKAEAKVALSGDYPADATLDTQGISLGQLLAVFAPTAAADITGQTELHATFHGPLKKRQQIEAHVTIPVFSLAYENSVQLSATDPVHIDYKDGTIIVQRSSIHGTDTDLQFAGTIPTSGSAPMSVLLKGTVDLQLIQLINPDLRTSGQLKLNVNSSGAIRNASFGGTIDVVNASIGSLDLPVALQNCNGSLALTNDRINITQLKGDVGGGTLTAQGGIALRPTIQFNMGLAAHDVRMLYPQGMRESIDANLRLVGSPTNASLGGDINLADLSFTNGFNLNDLIDQFGGGVELPPSRGFSNNVALNLAVHSSSNVNLVSRTLSVGGSANLRVRGTAAQPVILGRVNLTGGDIILNGTRFLLTGGTIQFVNPSVTEPVVNLTIATTIQQYNINLRFDGPIEQMRTQYNSDPSLPSADIIHLLAFGQTTEAGAASATSTNQAAESLVANQVSSQVTSRISKVAGISQLSINPVLANSNSQGPAGANITVQQRVTSNLFVTFSSNVSTTQGQTIQGQYQVSPRVAVSVTRDPNGGVAVDTLIKKSW